MIRAGVLCLVLGLVACGTGNRGATQCRVDGECPLHQWCDRGVCATGCLGNDSCSSGLVCNDHGRCVSITLGPGGDGGDAAQLEDAAAGDDAAVDLAQSDVDLAQSIVDLAKPRDLTAADLTTPPPDLTTPPPDLSTPPDLLMSCQGQTCPEQLGNGDIPHAAVIAEGGSVTSRSICPQGNIDFFKVVPSHGGTLQVSLTVGPCGWPLNVDVMNALGAIIGGGTSQSSGASAHATVTANQVVYIRVQALSPSGTNYYDLALQNN